MFLVRMRSPVRIWSAAPKKPVIATITGFFLCENVDNIFRTEKNATFFVKLCFTKNLAMLVKKP